MSRYRKFARLVLFVVLFAGPRIVSADEGGAVEVSIPRGEYQLRGQFFAAQGEGPLPMAILLPGIPGGEVDVLGLGSMLSAAGIHALSFNYSGTHASGGTWIPLAHDEADVGAVLEFVHGLDPKDGYHVDSSRVYVGGHSHGGGLALIYAARHPEVQHVFSIAGNDFGVFGRNALEAPALVKAIDVMFAGYFTEGTLRPEAGSQPQWEFLDHLDEVDVRGHAPLLAARRVFLAGGLDDGITPIEDHLLPVYRALKKAGAERVATAFYQTDHSFQGKRDQIAEDLIGWIRSDE